MVERAANAWAFAGSERSNFDNLFHPTRRLQNHRTILRSVKARNSSAKFEKRLWLFYCGQSTVTKGNAKCHTNTYANGNAHSNAVHGGSQGNPNRNAKSETSDHAICVRVVIRWSAHNPAFFTWRHGLSGDWSSDV
jgi:hypothetical protein